MLAGTEVGLGVPEPPSALTCDYDPGGNKLRLRWKNPSTPLYESMRLILNFHNYEHRAGKVLSGTAESYALDLSEYPKDTVEDLDIWLIGISHGLRSNAAALHVRRNIEEELFGIPFSRGTAPNWAAWSSDANGSVTCEMGQRDELVNRKGNKANSSMSAERKPFYQVVTAARAGAVGGVRRDFLGLTAGHTYRITVRLSTLALARDGGNWSCTLHAAPFGGDGKGVGAEQLSGLAALPDGSQGESAGLAAKFDPQKTTGGAYEECTKDVLVPQGMHSIAVWLRLTSQTPGDKVAVDYVMLEDLGPK
jgi:hypothetical protein